MFKSMTAALLLLTAVPAVASPRYEAVDVSTFQDGYFDETIRGTARIIDTETGDLFFCSMSAFYEYDNELWKDLYKTCWEFKSPYPKEKAGIYFAPGYKTIWPRTSASLVFFKITDTGTVSLCSFGFQGGGASVRYCASVNLRP